MAFDLIGISSLLFVVLIYLTVAIKKPSIANILLTALGIRILIIIFGNILSLPDNYGDVDEFLFRAIDYSEQGFLNLFSLYPGFSSFFISWLIALLFSIFGPSELMAQSLSLFFGVGSVYLGWKIACKIWNKKIANKVGWVIALFPTLILYSGLILRETYTCFFLLLALNSCIDWVKTKSYISLISVIVYFIIGTHFHTPILFGLIAFLILVFIENFKGTGKRIYKSGDIGRLLPSGEIEFLQRKDTQVKINGLRVELSEIEYQLEQIEAIEEAIVAIKKIEDINYLTAYIKSGQNLETEKIKRVQN